MFKFDDNFLNSVGLAELQEKKKAAFLEYAQDQLEVRIGCKLSGISADYKRLLRKAKK